MQVRGLRLIRWRLSQCVLFNPYLNKYNKLKGLLTVLCQFLYTNVFSYGSKAGTIAVVWSGDHLGVSVSRDQHSCF